MKLRTPILAIFSLLAAFSCGHENTTNQHGNIRGIDVSHHQGKVDWTKISKDPSIKFAYIKATEGRTMTDARFSYNARNASKNGILVGAYHFYSLTSSPEEQFKNFKKTCPKGSTDLIPMIDVEPRGKLTNERVRKVCHDVRIIADLMEDYYGKKPMLYCSIAMYDYCLRKEFGDEYVLCIGHPSKTPPILKGKKHYDIWQYTYSGKIAGVQQVFDMHRLHKETSLDMLKI